MNATELATEVLISQEIESLASCVHREQAPETYQDVVEKIRGHVRKLPTDRQQFWADQVLPLGAVLFPPPKKVDKKPGGTSVP